MRALAWIVVVSCLALLAHGAIAQDWSWPEEYKNLKKLDPQSVPPVMGGFTRSLGVGCSYCHVGEPGESLATYDFVSDVKQAKQTARVMLDMLEDIGETLQQIEPSGSKRVNIWCHTCHMGRPRPTTIAEELITAQEEEGIDAAIERYHELKKSYGERTVYDFRERSLNLIGYNYLQKGDAETAIRFFLLNSEQFPESPNVWDSLAEGYMTAGDRDKARQYYAKSLELDPDNENAKQKLEELAGEE